MGVAFPLGPIPAQYTRITPGRPHGVYYVGGAGPTFTLTQSGATAYAVRDYYGTVLTSGTVSGTSLTPTPPAGGWKPGWYRLYLTGPTSDAMFGTAYGSSNFTVLRNDPRFPTMVSVASLNSVDDVPAQAIMGMGFPRPFLNSTTAYSTDLATVQAQVAQAKTYYAVGSSDPFYDAARPRPLMCPFPNGTTDGVTISGLRLYCKDETIDGSTVTVTAAAGTSSGTKITVNGETYDNLATADAAVTAINAASSLVKAFGTGTLTTLAATAIGNAYFNGIKAVVNGLYPDVTRFEGPSNEPPMNAETAHKMRLFAGAVHAGNAAAKAIGPCPVSISGIGGTMEPFFAAGGGAWCDEISVHAYNAQTNGDINLGRTSLDAFTALLAKYGQQGKTLWQTESVWVMTCIYGVYHPRRARVPLIQTIQWEQYGVPRERNSYWYGISHGYWGVPAFWITGDGTFAPQAAMYRTLAEETFGQTHTQALDFGTIGNRIFLGSVYTGTSGSTAVLVAASYIPNATVTLTVTGATTLTAADAFGNTSTVTATNGKAAVPVSDIPTYVRLPAGASVAVATCNDWPANRSGWTTSSTRALAPAAYLANDGKMLTQYTGTPKDDGAHTGTTVPDTVTLGWPTATRLDRVIIWTGCWQTMSALIDFDVQTSNNGTTWTTRTTVTRPAPASFLHGVDSSGTGTQYDTYWDEQWIFDVKLPAPVTAKYVRLNVRATSYGGEPDAQAMTAGGQGASAQYVTVQEIAVMCDDNTNLHVATVA